MEFNLKEIEQKWQKKWELAKIFFSEVNKNKKFFANFPYPYMNGFLHIGHSLTLLRVECLSRFKRMQGFNVLFPFAFHCTGTPIVASAQRIKEGEETQIKILKDMAIKEEEIKNFANPIYWTKYFPKEAKEDLIKLGISVDWRRSFITTNLNPIYNKFIHWQFRKLKEKNFVVLGEHPVIWCKKCNAPVGDHDRIKGEGEKPQEFTLLKFKIEEEYLIAATLRPETVFGQTNLWIDADVVYIKVKVNDEIWIVSKECAEKLKEQKKEVKIIAEIKGKELIGKEVIAPKIKKKIIILPSKFCDVDYGTGIVTSVPSDAPDDYRALMDLKENEEECKKYNLDFNKVKEIKIIPIIKSSYGELPAIKIVEEMQIKSQEEREKLEKAKEIVYKSGYYSGIMNENCENYRGMKVEIAKELIKKELLKENSADIMYEPSGEVVCRCLTKSIVKLVSNQWFIAYGNKQWKEEAHNAIEKMKFYPELVRKQFHNVVDWLDDWACTREFGLGTELPWDKKWLIESLSDSTIYMAYYTIAKHLEYEKSIKEENINDEFFDFVFLSKGNEKDLAKKLEISEDKLKEIKDEFEYWYPFDIRVSGKDLVQNHLTFCIFNHIAVFGEKYIPKAFGINGWILVDGEKMSKSAGNFFTLREIINKYSADVVRITLAYGGEGIDDPNWDTDFAKNITKRLVQWYEFCIENYNKGRDEFNEIDFWFLSILNKLVEETRNAMEETLFRTALKLGYFDLQKYYEWYEKRANLPNKNVINEFIEVQTKILAPFVPHLAEEIWEKIGKKEFISLAEYPKYDELRKNLGAELKEEFLISVINDINEILKVIGIKPNKIVLYTAEKWKEEIFRDAIRMAKEGKLELSNLIKASIEKHKQFAKEIPKFCQNLSANLKKISKDDLERFSVEFNEKDYLMNAKEFLEGEFNCKLEIYSADEQNIYNPKEKAKFSLPRRVAIYVE